MPEVQEDVSLEEAAQVALGLLKILNDAGVPYDVNTAIAFSMLSAALAKEMGATAENFGESAKNIFQNIKPGVLFQKTVVDLPPDVNKSRIILADG